MRQRNVKNAHQKLLESSYFILNPQEYCCSWAKYFQNDNPIKVEIGTGKGQFLIAMAKENPHCNFIGVEQKESVLLRAVCKAQDTNLPNLRFICYNALNIKDVFNKEVETIYLNFSDPWPKSRHEKRRLTSPNFLEQYDKIFKDDKIIIMKTDNIKLFGYSIVSLSKHGYIFDEVSLDLAHDEIHNIKTEYEEKFSNLGYKINYLKAVKKNKKM